MTRRLIENGTLPALWDRRTVASGLLGVASASWSGVAHAQSDAPGPIVETQGGRLQGQIDQGVATFKGVPYGASTANGGRFRPPRPAPPWRGVRSAFAFGPAASQNGPPSLAARAFCDLIESLGIPRDRGF
ncbi:carboxylesterase family protein [Phenylobacterium sp.]|uniref:carboxylesterase family protein n=1 Tax=Phenylobacterium sp. TaxID=1871053 RepID=UPI00351F6781